jgi:hypothetical protein
VILLYYEKIFLNRGFIANFAQDVKELIKVLPSLPTDLLIIVLEKRSK